VEEVSAYFSRIDKGVSALLIAIEQLEILLDLAGDKMHGVKGTWPAPLKRYQTN
jgi:hypothetical protein